MPDAAVIIPHYNDIQRLGRCLDALMPQVTSDIEVIVVDNASTESLAGVRAAHPGVRIVTETRKGAALARNRGVAETTAPWIYFLDCDCVPAPDWLAAAGRVRTRGDLVGGTITLFDETPGPRSGAEAFETVFAFNNRSYVETKGFSVTANLLTRREVWDAVGEFRPGLSEDLDWCHRARSKGFRLVHADDLRVAHPTRADWPALERKWLRLTAESWELRGKGPTARALWAARGFALIASIAMHAPKVLLHTELRGPERRAALATLARLRLRRCGWMLGQALGRDL
ncbi:glycosyltransferase family 2 protein [Rubellimicrobium roseum]|uniref:Glycosyltransferase family 2 protein n=1 Tax=Rubellimicrobium roseum TaxID=687525 RepID=A0A5C4NIY7_9RHOB|nr:glycosyltransferase family A protein [Rubellimicrobium roseum]TNC74794.1 glycosyltransferase family 2 protein [Rubellimicrobium roseum]